MLFQNIQTVRRETFLRFSAKINKLKHIIAKVPGALTGVELSSGSKTEGLVKLIPEILYRSLNVEPPVTDPNTVL